MENSIEKRNSGKCQKGITLIALVITILILLMLAVVTIKLALGNNGIIKYTELAKQEDRKQTASETMQLKITNLQMENYAQNKRLPSLQELADGLCEDDEMEYVLLTSQKMAKLNKIEVGQNKSIFTKLKKYPYEFEINGQLRLASIDGVKVEDNNVAKVEIDKEVLESLIPKQINEHSLLLSSMNVNKELGTFNLSQYDNTKSEKFDNYFTLDEGTGELTCKVSGWYCVNFKVSVNSALNDWSETRQILFLNNVEIEECGEIVQRGTVGIDTSSSTVFLYKNDKIRIEKTNNNSALSNNSYGMLKIFKL